MSDPKKAANERAAAEKANAERDAAARVPHPGAQAPAAQPVPAAAATQTQEQRDAEQAALDRVEHDAEAAKRAKHQSQNEDDAAKARAADDAAPPAWQKPDYAGPLDCEQAMWRNENLKRHGDYHTKPAEAPSTK